MGTKERLLHALAQQEVFIVAAEVIQRAVGLHFDDPVREAAHELTVVRDETYS